METKNIKIDNEEIEIITKLDDSLKEYLIDNNNLEDTIEIKVEDIHE